LNHQRLSRLQFLSSAEPEPPVSVREAIGKSWKRSRLSGLKPGQFVPPHAVTGAEQEDRLIRAARPVLQRLGEQLSDCKISVAVTNPHAIIAERWVTNRHLERQLDRLMLAAGFSYAEEHIGTNAIGTALEQGGSVAVAGGEHFADALQDMGCAAAPIHDPRTGRVLGIVDLTSMHRHFNSVMLPVVLQAAADVEQRLVDELSVGEHLLLERFLQATRRARRPVVVMNDRIVLENPAAAKLLGSTDRAVLWEEMLRVREAPTKPGTTIRVGDGVVMTARLQPIMDGDTVVGELVEIVSGGLPRTRPGHRPVAGDTPAQLPLLVGRSSRWAETVKTAVQYARGRGRVMIVGEAGVGKLAVARAMHELGGENSFVVRDAADVATEGMAGWIERTVRALAGPPATVVIRHVELLETAMAHKVAKVIDDETHRRTGWLLATLTSTTTPPAGASASAGDRLLVRFPDAIHVPPLRQRTDDIPVLVRHWLGERRCTPDFMSALMAQRWPGNLQELQELLLALRSHAEGRGTLGLTDLPSDYRVSRPRGLTLLEQTEYDAIVGALAACHGKKVLAAKRLEMSRSTLYRKMAALGIDGA
jgi:sigma-54 dependent transcriptional regulator, acetoin dehydrogenase operon transcriptional activator AcoR